MKVNGNIIFLMAEEKSLWAMEIDIQEPLLKERSMEQTVFINGFITKLLQNIQETLRRDLLEVKVL